MTAVGEAAFDERHEVKEEILTVDGQTGGDLVGGEDTVGIGLSRHGYAPRVEGAGHHGLGQDAEEHQQAVDHRVHAHCTR